MARITIELPEHFGYRTEIPLLSMHMNFTGHLDNAMVLSLVSEARIRLWNKLGIDPMAVAGVAVAAADAAVQYKSEAFHGETLVVEKAVRDYHKYGFDFVWRLTEKTSGREVARGKTGILCLDPVARKVATMPDALKKRLESL